MECFIVRLPEKAEVLLLEDSEMRILWFQKRIPELKVCRTVAEFKAFFENNPSLFFIFWDHDLGEEETGADAAKWFSERYGAINGYHVIHSHNQGGARNIQSYIRQAVCMPFGSFEVEFD
jgi:hypothetical protein